MTASKGGRREGAAPRSPGSTAARRTRRRSPARSTFSGSRYPGDKAVEKASDARCKKYFARYVGIDWDSSAYNYDYATPDSSELAAWGPPGHLHGR